jgi:hypothetical protein
MFIGASSSSSEEASPARARSSSSMSAIVLRYGVYLYSVCSQEIINKKCRRQERCNELSGEIVFCSPAGVARVSVKADVQESQTCI